MIVFYELVMCILRLIFHELQCISICFVVFTELCA